jgi:phosphoribosyl 1,2-cyclic phosphate phosphodiesterase
MKITILGSGGCTVIPRPLCLCRLCREARIKGEPYKRTGPSLFLNDIRLLIDTPAESAYQLNRQGIERVDYLMFTHLDPDHTEGFRVVEQMTLDFRTWQNYPGHTICLLLPEPLDKEIYKLQSVYGPFIEFYEQQGFVRCLPFKNHITIKDIKITAFQVKHGDQVVFIYVFEQKDRKLIYAPCDVKPFPEDRNAVQNADLLLIQPGIFETGLPFHFNFPQDHFSRSTLYTFEQTLELSKRIKACSTIMVHLEEYWGRSYDDYRKPEKDYEKVRFAYDGMRIKL